MNNRNRCMISLAACAVATLGMNGAAESHHSNNQFEYGVCTDIKGTVRTLEWVYPHVWLWVIVPGKSADDVWGFEFPSPTQVMNLDKRWSKSALQKGDKVTVTFSPMKDGRHGGWMHSVTAPDGAVLAGAPGRCDRTQASPGAAK